MCSKFSCDNDKCVPWSSVCDVDGGWIMSSEPLNRGAFMLDNSSHLLNYIIELTIALKYALKFLVSSPCNENFLAVCFSSTPSIRHCVLQVSWSCSWLVE